MDIVERLQEYADDCAVDGEPVGFTQQLMIDAITEIERLRSLSDEPVAWYRDREILDRDGRPIGSDDPEIEWSKEAPDIGWFPLYTRSVPGMRDEVIEMCAKVADRHTWDEGADGPLPCREDIVGYHSAAREIASSIRSLKQSPVGKKGE